VKFWLLPFALVALVCVSGGQIKPEPRLPFTLKWMAGRCFHCQFARELDHVRFTGRTEAWAVGDSFPPPGAFGAGNYIVVHTIDAGHTWKELSQTYAHAVSPAFSFLDAARGWIAWWNPADDPKVIHTFDGGRHWESISQESLQIIQFFDGQHGYGAEVTKFLRTVDGGRTWTETQIPRIRAIDRMLFLSRDVGWIAGTDGTNLFVFRTTDGGRSWRESRTTGPKGIADVQDLFFLNPARGWLITWDYNDGGTYLFSTVDGGRSWAPEDDRSFQGRGKWAGVVRFVSEENGFVSERDDAGGNSFFYTLDGGARWRRKTLQHTVHDCQIFKGDLLCSSNGFLLLTVHPNTAP